MAARQSGEPSLAVVIPTLDEAHNIPAQLERLLAAADPLDRADELVVSDGGSGDATCALAREGGAQVLTGARGRGEQLGAGARVARADVLVFLHADNRLPPGSLRALRGHFARTSLGAAGLRQRIAARGWFYRAVERAADRRVRRGIVYGDSTLCVRRELYERSGGFAPTPLFEDLELSRRLATLARIELLSDVFVEVDARRWRREGALTATLRNWALRVAFELGAAPERLARWYPPSSSGSRRTPARDADPEPNR